MLGRRFTDTSAYTLIFLLEFAKNIYPAEIMGIQQHRRANG